MKISTEEYVLGGIAAFLIAVVFIFGGGGAKSPEKLGEMVFKAVASNDKEGSQKMVVTVDDMIFMIDESAFPPEAKKEAREKVKENKQRMADDHNRYWDLLITRLESSNIDRSKMVMGKIEVQEQMQQGMMSKSLKGARISVPFTAGDKHGTLRFAGFENKGWKLVPPIGLVEDEPGFKPGVEVDAHGNAVEPEHGHSH